MSLKIQTTLTEEQEGSLENQFLVNNLIEGDESSDFQIDAVDRKIFSVSYTLSATYSINIFDHVSITKANATFIHVLCYKRETSTSVTPDPIKFTVSFDAVEVFKGSQFQLANISDFDKEILISEIAGLAAGEYATLIIVVGGKLS